MSYSKAEIANAKASKHAINFQPGFAASLVVVISVRGEFVHVQTQEGEKIRLNHVASAKLMAGEYVAQ